MNILDRILVIKSYLPPEDTKVLWIDMSTDPKNAKIWNANNARWESVISNAADVDLYLKEVKDALRKKAGVMGNPTDNSSTYSGTLEYENKPFFPHTKDSNILVTGRGTLDKELLKLISSEKQNLNKEAKKQARDNIEAVGAIVYEDGTIELTYKGNTIQPSTTTDYVKVGEGNLTEELNKINTKISSNGNDIKDLEDTLHEVDERSAETKERVDIFLKDADTSEKAKDTLLELQSYIEEDKSGAAQMLQSITENERDIQNEIFRATQKENELESNIIAESTRAQLAETNLNTELNKVKNELTVTNEAVVEEFTFEPHNQDSGVAQINSIHGNSVVWNNIVKNQITHGSKYIVTKNSDGSYVVKLNPNFDGTTGNNWINDFTDKLENGHRYYFYIPYKVSGLSEGVTAELNLYAISAVKQYGKTGITNGIGSHSVIFDCDYTGSDNGKISPFIPLGELNAEFTIYGDRKCVDLTKMFNGVNVPTTVEEFEALYGNMPNEYNTGVIIDNHTSAIKSVGVNMLDVSGDVLSPPVVGYNNPSMPKDWAIVGKMYSGVNDGGTVSNVPVSKIKKIKDGFEITCESSAYGLGFFVKVLPNTLYDTSIGKYDNIRCIATFYDKNRLYLSKYYTEYGGNPYGGRFRTPSNCEFVFLVFTISGGGTGIMPYPVCHLSHDGYMTGKYTPYPYYEDFVRELPTVEGGLKSAGTAYDEIRYNKSKDKWEYIQRVGQVDLGKLEWYYGNPSGNAKKVFYSENVKTKLGITSAQGDTLKPNILSANYTSKVPYDTLVVETVNKAITAWANQAELYRIVVADTAYTDVATFKAAMQGVILYYELAEPIVTELSDDYNLSYQISNCGTVEAISDGLSSPFKGKIEYSTTIANKINSNIRQIEYLDNKINEIFEEVNQINVTYDELVSLRDNSKLKPGCWYRITDYVTTTSQENTQSAGHQFDVLVLATDVNVLSEEARAIQHGGEDIIMYGTNYTDAPEMSNVYQLLPTNESFPASDGKTYWIYDCFAYGVKVNDVTLVTLNNPPQYGESIGATEDLSTVDFESMPLTIGEEITTSSDYFYNSNLNTWKLWYCLDNDTNRFEWATNGTGVIYRMIDEYGNDCPYDFKNILFNNLFTFGRNVDFTMISANRSILNTIESSYLNNKRVLPVVTFESTSNNTRVDNNVFYINVRGIGNSNVVGTTILYGVSGTYNNILEIEIPNNNLPMKVAKNSNGEIKIYNEVDLVQ